MKRCNEINEGSEDRGQLGSGCAAPLARLRHGGLAHKAPALLASTTLCKAWPTLTSSSTTLASPAVARPVTGDFSDSAHPDRVCPLFLQFARLYLEATATPYVDTALTEGQSAVKPYLEGSFPGSGERFRYPSPSPHRG